MQAIIFHFTRLLAIFLLLLQAAEPSAAAAPPPPPPPQPPSNNANHNPHSPPPLIAADGSLFTTTSTPPPPPAATILNPATHPLAARPTPVAHAAAAAAPPANPQVTPAPASPAADADGDIIEYNGAKYRQTTYYTCVTVGDYSHCGWHMPLLVVSSDAAASWGRRSIAWSGAVAAVLAVAVLVVA